MEINEFKKIKILTTEEILKIGVNYEDICFDGVSGMEAYKDNGERFTGLCYELAPNAEDIISYMYYVDGIENGIHVVFKSGGIPFSCCEKKAFKIWGAYISWYDYEKDIPKEISYWKFGKNLFVEQYNEKGELLQGTGVINEENLKYIKEQEARYELNRQGQLILKEIPRADVVSKYVEQISTNSFTVGLKQFDIANLEEYLLVDIQNGLKNRISKENKIKDIKTIAGVDLAYFEVENKEYAVCIIAVIDYVTGDLLGFVNEISEISQKYIPGCLAFREIPIFLKAYYKLKTELNIEPDVYMFDGNGYLHPRNMGLATHAGIVIDKPTFGVAKSYFKVDNTDFIMPENFDGATTNIVVKDEVLGVSYRSHKDVKPVFISTGNHIDLQTAINITKQMITKESRIPLPTRYADSLANELRKKVLDSI